MKKPNRISQRAFWGLKLWRKKKTSDRILTSSIILFHEQHFIFFNLFWQSEKKHKIEVEKWKMLNLYNTFAIERNRERERNSRSIVTKSRQEIRSPKRNSKFCLSLLMKRAFLRGLIRPTIENKKSSGMGLQIFQRNLGRFILFIPEETIVIWYYRRRTRCKSSHEI